MISLLLWVAFGAFVGWIASLVMRRDAQQGSLMNILVGVVGVSPDFLSLGSMLTALVGAVVLLGIVNLVQRGAVR